MADFWMKLYTEILDDPKMATLPDRIWRRIIELFLAAKRVNHDGHLPDTRQLAWMLRMIPDELEHDMMQIAQTGIIEREVNGWFIPKFAQRQAAVSPAERKAQERARKYSRQYYEDVTEQSRSVTQRREEKRREEEGNSAPLSPDWTPQMEAQNLLQQVTGLAASPPDELIKYTPAILAIKDKHNGGAVDYMKGFYSDWLTRRTKEGRAYKRTALGWVEWALEGSAPAAPVPAPRKRRPIDKD